MNVVGARNYAFLAVSIVVVAGIVGGAAYGAGGNANSSTNSSSTASDQGCKTYPGNTQPNLFGQQVSSVKQVTLSENYTSDQLQKATQVALDDNLVKTLIENRTDVDYATFQQIQSGEDNRTGGFYTVTTATGYTRNGSSLIPITAGSVLTQYRLCGTTLYQVWTPQGVVVRVLLSPNTTTTNPFGQGQVLVTIGEVDLTVNTTLWSVVGTGFSPTASI